MINKCTCHSPYQDKKHGKGNRVFNLIGRGKSGDKRGVARCTVCGYVLQNTAGVVVRKTTDVV